MNPNKAASLDKMPPKIINLSVKIIDSHLASITNYDLYSNWFSEGAKIATVWPIFKNSDTDNIKNERIAF